MAISALGTTIKKGTTLIAELTSISGLDISAETIDTTSLDDSYKTFIGGTKDAGEVGLSGHFLKTQVTTILADLNDGSVDAYTITFPDGSTWAFDAVVTGISTGAEMDATVSFEATLKVSGQPTFTEGV